MIVKNDLMPLREGGDIGIPVAADPAEPRNQQDGRPRPVRFVIDVGVADFDLRHDLHGVSCRPDT